MKANRPVPLRGMIAATALAVLAASCASPPPPRPEPRPQPQPTYVPPPPPPRVEPPLSWQDAPITPGTWRWSRIGDVSSARFAEGPRGAALEFRCDRGAGIVLLIRAGGASEPVPMTITTTSTTRPVTARPLDAGQPAIAVSLAARDPLLDAIVFSRGRFAVEALGYAPIYAPSWPEIARVVEDCR